MKDHKNPEPVPNPITDKADPKPGHSGEDDGTPQTKKEIIKAISDRIGLTQVETRKVVQGTFDAILDAILSRGRIELRNFGVFEIKKRKARIARNPRTGAEVHVAAKRVVIFKPGRLMEDRIK